MIALAYRQDGHGLVIRVAICVKKNEKKKGRNKEESAGEKKLRFMTTISMTLVQVPQTMVLTFFPTLVEVASVFYRWSVVWLMTDLPLVVYGMWQDSNLSAEP